MSLRFFCISLILVGCGQAWAAEVALVMSVQGKVTRLAEPMPAAVEAFVKLKDGDRLSLEKMPGCRWCISRAAVRKPGRAPVVWR